MRKTIVKIELVLFGQRKELNARIAGYKKDQRVLTAEWEVFETQLSEAEFKKELFQAMDAEHRNDLQQRNRLH